MLKHNVSGRAVVVIAIAAAIVSGCQTTGAGSGTPDSDNQRQAMFIMQSGEKDLADGDISKGGRANVWQKPIKPEPKYISAIGFVQWLRKGPGTQPMGIGDKPQAMAAAQKAGSPQLPAIILSKFGNGIPDAVVTSGWIYLTGDGPCAGGKYVSAQSEGTRIILQTILNGNQRTERVVTLETRPGGTVRIYDLHGYPDLHKPVSTNVLVPAGKYYEKTFTEGQAEESPAQNATVDVIPDPVEHPESPIVQLINEVEVYRVANNVP